MKASEAMEQPRRAAIYARISETDGKRDKVATQVEDCRALCKSEGYVVVDVFRDDGISAFKEVERPEYDRMKKAIANGRYDVVVAAAEDRFTRDMLESLSLFVLCKKSRVFWHTIHRGVRDPADRNQKLMAALTGWQSEEDVAERIEKQKDAFSARRRAGLPLWGNRPFGFELDRITHRADEADEIRWAYEQVASGATIYSILKAWTERDVVPASQADAPAQLRKLRKETLGRELTDEQREKLEQRKERLERLAKRPGWTHAGLIQLLRRPSNAGLISHSVRNDDSRRTKTGEIELREGVPAAWEPIVDRDLWQAVQDRLDTNGKQYSTENREGRWLLAGIALCGVCGSVMRSASVRVRGEAVSVYRCATRSLPRSVNDRQRHCAVRVDDIDPLIPPAIASHFLFSGPSADADPARDSDAQAMRGLLRRLVEIRDEQAAINAVLGRPGVNDQTQLRKLEALEAERESVEVQRRALAQQSAHAAMLADAREELLAAWTPRRKRARTELDRLLGTGQGKRADMERLAELKAELAERFKTLPLQQQRTLVRALLVVSVNPGRSSSRIDIRYVGRPSLNADVG